MFFNKRTSPQLRTTLVLEVVPARFIRNLTKRGHSPIGRGTFIRKKIKTLKYYRLRVSYLCQCGGMHTHLSQKQALLSGREGSSPFIGTKDTHSEKLTSWVRFPKIRH